MPQEQENTEEEQEEEEEEDDGGVYDEDSVAFAEREFLDAVLQVDLLKDPCCEFLQ